MTSIHMETEVIREAARKLNLTASDISSEVNLMGSSFRKLETVWQGGSSGKIIADFQQLVTRFEAQSDSLTALSTRLEREVDEWESADRSFGKEGITAVTHLNAPGFTPQAATLSGMVFGAFLPITKQIDNGIRALYKTGMDVGNSLHSATSAMVNSSDHAIDGKLKELLSQQRAGSTETMAFKTRGEVVIPGIEVGVPGSFKGALASEGELTRNPDGTYVLMLKGGGGLGLKEDLFKAKGNLRFGNWKAGGGVEAGAEAMLATNSESRYQFDPSKPGEMTKMTTFLAALGLLSATSNSAAIGPALYTLKDNLIGFKTSSGLEGKVKADAHVLVKLVGLKEEGSAMVNNAVNKTSNGFEHINGVELGLKDQTSLLGSENGTEYKVSLDAIRNPATNTDKARVTVTLKKEVGDDNAFKLKDLKNYIPKTDLKAINLEAKKGMEIKVEYELDQPAETLKRTLFNSDGRINLEHFNQNTHMKVNVISSQETGAGANAGLGAGSQSVDIGLDLSAIRSSESTIYKR